MGHVLLYNSPKAECSYLLIRQGIKIYTSKRDEKRCEIEFQHGGKNDSR
jgi:hypothetical protein